MVALREVAAVFEIDWDDKALKEGVHSIDGAFSALQRFGDLVANNALVQGLINFAVEFSDQAGQIEDTAETLGLSTAEFQELGYAAEQGGMSVEMMTSALATLQRGAQTAAQTGVGPAAEALRYLGVTATDASGQVRNVADLADEVAGAFDDIEDPARRATLAQQLFGGSGRRMLTLLKDGEGGLTAWREEFQALGGGLSQESIEAAGQFGDEMNRMKVALDSVRAQLAVALLPAIKEVASWFTRAAVVFHQITDNTNAMKAAVYVLGAVMVAVAAAVLVAWAPVLVPILGFIAAVAAIILIVDDLITLFEGGDSAIGRFLDRILGVGGSARAVASLRAAFASLMETIETVGQTLSGTFATIAERARALGTWLSVTFGGAANAAREFVSAVGSLLAALGTYFAQLGERIWDSIAGTFERAWARVRQLLSGPGANLIARVAPQFANFLQAGFEAATSATRNATTSVRNATSSTQVNQTVHAPITVQGADDPEATARAVRRQLTAEQQAATQSALAARPGRAAPSTSGGS